MSKLLEKSIKAVEDHGLILVFPIKNSKDPLALWHVLHPKSEMRWEWDENGDDRVSKLWFLREELSRSNRVVYSKWFRNRATLMSFKMFQALNRILLPKQEEIHFVSKEILEILEQDSPISTRTIKELAGLKGREQERHYNAHMKELWSKLLIVGYGEFDDGAFPSLGVGATMILFEDQVLKSQKMSLDEAWKTVEKFMPPKTAFRKFFDSLTKDLDHESRA